MTRYRLSKRAQRDLLEIFTFGHEQFGESQAEIDAASLDHLFSLLGENPRMGRLAETIAPGVRAMSTAPMSSSTSRRRTALSF